MQKISIKTKGMKCAGCAARVQKALLLLEGIEAVEADFETNTVQVDAKEGVSAEKVKEKISDLGFEVVE